MITTRIAPSLPLALALMTGACGAGGGEPEPGGRDGDGGTGWDYSRDYVFIGTRADEPLAVPFSFSAVPRSDSIERVARAWLGQGARWESFLDEHWSSSPNSGAWRVLPRGDLRVSAEASGEIESLRYRHEARHLRLDLGAPLSGWYPLERARYRVREGTLTVGGERVEGLALEALDVRRLESDPGRMRERIFLRGDSILLLVVVSAEAGRVRGWTWSSLAGAEATGTEVRLDWTEARQLQEARRDLPLRWRFTLPELGLAGELEAVGSEVGLGTEDAPRRSIDVRYTVQGWVVRNGRRWPVAGTLRHTQG